MENLQNKAIPCAYCQGRGKDKGSTMGCIVCKGKGTNTVNAPHDACGSCNGKGRKKGIALYCLGCRGTGVSTCNRQGTSKNMRTISIGKVEGAEPNTSWLKRFIKNLSAKED